MFYDKDLKLLPVYHFHSLRFERIVSSRGIIEAPSSSSSKVINGVYEVHVSVFGA